MKPFHTRVIQIAYEWRPAERWRNDRTRIVVVVLFPPAVKRQLATLEAATTRAVELARQKIQRALAMPPKLEALKCSVQVIDFDLRPFWDVATTLEDGTKVSPHRGGAGARLPVLSGPPKSPVRPPDCPPRSFLASPAVKHATRPPADAPESLLAVLWGLLEPPLQGCIEPAV